MVLGKKATGIVLIMILLGYGMPAFGTEINLDTMDNKWLTRHTPVVCVHESLDVGIAYDYKKIVDITKKAAKTWEDKLVKYSGGDREDWEIKVKGKLNPDQMWIRTGHWVNCDINVLLRGAPVLNFDTSFVSAYTQHFESIRMWHDIVLYTWGYTLKSNASNEGGPIHMEAKVQTPKQLEKIMIHELGHTFGLKHTLWEGKEARGKYCDQMHADFSIMYVGAGCISITDIEIEEIDYSTLIYKFGTDGWGGYTNFNFKGLTLNR